MGFLPGILGPCMIPSVWPSPSSALRRRIASARSDRALRLSLPWIVLAAVQRCLPCSVRGPVLFPPWLAHLFLPFEAGARHCCFVRLDLAWHWTQRIRPPAVTKVKLFDMELHLVGSRLRLGFWIAHWTPWTSSGCLSWNVDCLGSLEYLDLIEFLDYLDYLEYVEPLHLLLKNEGIQASQGIHRVRVDLLPVWLRRLCQTTYLEQGLGLQPSTTCHF